MAERGVDFVMHSFAPGGEGGTAMACMRSGE